MMRMIGGRRWLEGVGDRFRFWVLTGQLCIYHEYGPRVARGMQWLLMMTKTCRYQWKCCIF